MGYRCPVCDTPQRDAGHLADHLAFTAMLRGEDHEAWLDERVPEWGELGTETLADRVVGYAPEAEFEAVFEDTTGGPHTHAHDHGRDPTHATDRGRPDVDVDAAAARDRLGASTGASVGAGDADLDAETQAVVREARELTQEMLADADADESAESDAADSDGGAARTDGADADADAGAAGGDAPDADADAAGVGTPAADEEKES